MNYEQWKQEIHFKYYIAILKFHFDPVKEVCDQAQPLGAFLCPIQLPIWQGRILNSAPVALMFLGSIAF